MLNELADFVMFQLLCKIMDDNYCQLYIYTNLWFFLSIMICIQVIGLPDTIGEIIYIYTNIYIHINGLAEKWRKLNWFYISQTMTIHWILRISVQQLRQPPILHQCCLGCNNLGTQFVVALESCKYIKNLTVHTLLTQWRPHCILEVWM